MKKLKLTIGQTLIGPAWYVFYGEVPILRGLLLEVWPIDLVISVAFRLLREGVQVNFNEY